jgi:oligopeptidase B
LFQDHCVLYERSHEAGAPALTVLDRRHNNRPYRLVLPPEAASGKLQPGLNQDFAATVVRFSITSPILPDVTYECHLADRTLSELHRERLPGRPAFDPANRYACQRVLVPSSPGGEKGQEEEQEQEEVEKIPLTLAYRRDLQPGADTRHPVLLMGYGAYGVCLDVGFRPELLPLLERGWLLAFAHVRGGGEKGRRWHAQGKGAHKLKSLLDYVSCADWLVEQGWTGPGLIAAQGGSAGALVVAGAAHRRPELFGAMVLKAPFLDFRRTMTDPTLPLTVHEYDEWGDPRRSAGLGMDLISPYDTLPTEAPSFPPSLLLASLADDRVKGWEAAKYAAKARSMRLLGVGLCRRRHHHHHQQQQQQQQQQEHHHHHPEVLLRMEGDHGHEGPPTHAEMLQQAAFEQAFMLSRVGRGEPKGGSEGEGGRSSVLRAPRRRGGGRDRERYLLPVPPLAFW